MENIQIEKSELKGLDINQIETNRPDIKISIQKVENEYKPLSPSTFPRSPRLVEVPKVGIELLENRSRKKDNSMDMSFGPFNGSEEIYDMPIEDFTNIREKIEGNKPSLFDFIQKKESKDSKSKEKRTNIPTGSPKPLKNFAPIKDSFRPNLGKETLQDLSFENYDISMDKSLGNDLKFSLDDLDKNIGGTGDPFDFPLPQNNPIKTEEFKQDETEKKEGVDDLENLNIDDLLSECGTLKEKHGINTPGHFNRKTPPEEVKAFIRRERKKREKVNAEKLGAKILLTTITALEFLNNKFDPFDLKLDGWSESIHENIDDYGEVFGELFEKYKTSTKVPPEVKLIMMIGGSAAMVHLTNTMFKTSIPGMEDMLKQNPDMMRQFAQAAQTQMGQGPAQTPPQAFDNSTFNKNTSNIPPKNMSAPPPPVQTRPDLKGPSLNIPPPMRQNNETNHIPAGPMRPIAPSMPLGSGLPAMPKREMRGPSGIGVDDILKEITLTNPITGKKSPSGSVVSKGNNQRRTINLNLN
jgi:hypothetical protein